MDKALYVGMTGAKHNALGQALLANNMANANTTGFRQDFAQARSMAIYGGDGYPTRVYSLTERPGTDFEPGSMQETGRDLDIAVERQGWIAVQAPDGSEAYTRAGNLTVDPLGRLLTGNGLPVLGNGGPIALPPAQKIEILADGTVSVREMGQGPEVVAQVDRIKLVNPPLEELEKSSDGLVRMKSGEPAQEDPNVTVASGFLEGSNVNVVEAMTQIMALSRQYEMNVKVMRAAEENSASAGRILQGLA